MMQFKAFKPEALNKIAGAMGYQGDMSQFQQFVEGDPQRKAQMQRYTNAAMQMARGGAVRKLNLGGNLVKFSEERVTKPGVPPGGTTVAAMTPQTAGQDIAAGTGQIGGALAVAPTTAGTATVSQPQQMQANLMQAEQIEGDVDTALQGVQAEQTTVDPRAEVTAEQQTTSAVSGLQEAQGTAILMNNPVQRQIQQGEMISGSAVDASKVAQSQAQIQAAQATPTQKATVQGQLDGLMQQFQGGATPAWAAGAMRAANAQMAARGLSASSMAGMAVVQAAMESALPIAQMDAANKQQVAIESAKQRAAFLNMEFNQEFETKVRNAAKISEIANMNFTAEQQVALENAKMAQTMNLANLSNRQAKVMADAATMAQMDMTNLNNRQQAQVQNAKAFLQMDMANLNNQQQTAIFKAQQMTSTLLSDAAAENAARQFNASSQNQTDQFFANLSSQVERFNTEQANQINRFNAGEANAISQFNATQQAAREQFNANNALVIAQANAQWFQSITTAETAAQNQMNRDAAIQASKMTETAYNAAVQMERDTISYAFRAGESQAERDLEIVLQGMRNSMTEAEIQAQVDTSKGKGWGTIANTVVELGLKKIFGFS